MQLVERTLQGSNKLDIDREHGVIRNCRILGNTSKNKRRYTENAKRDCARLYGVVNIDHPTDPHAERGLMDSPGRLQNKVVREDGVYADFHVLMTHPAADLLFERALKMPDTFGFSHNADGKVSQKDGVTIVESVESVVSVDLVQNPATNKSLFESIRTRRRTMKCKTIEAILRTAPPKTVGRASLASLLELDANLGTSQVPIDELPVEAGNTVPSAQEEVNAAFGMAALAVFNDESDDEPTLEKIGELLKAKRIVTDTEEPSDTPPIAESPEPASDPPPAADPPPKSETDPPPKDEEDKDKDVKESVRKLTESVISLTRESHIRTVLDEYGMSLSSLTLPERKLLESQDTPELMKQIIDGWPPYRRAPSTDRTRRMTESTAAVEYPTSPAELIRMTR